MDEKNPTLEQWQSLSDEEREEKRMEMGYAEILSHKERIAEAISENRYQVNNSRLEKSGNFKRYATDNSIKNRSVDVEILCSCTVFGTPMVKTAYWKAGLFRSAGADYHCPNCGLGRRALHVRTFRWLPDRIHLKHL